MLKAYKYKLSPNIKQSILLNKTFGCVRFYWNKQTEVFNNYNKESDIPVKFKTSTEYRKENKWIQEVSAAAIQQKEIDFKQFKTQYFNKSRKKSIGRPSFKKRNTRQSFRLPNQKFSIVGNTIKLEKIGKLSFIIDRQLPENCKLLSVTVSKDTCNKYYISILVDTEIKQFKKTHKTIGIDVGIKEFAVLSNGTTISNPHYFRNSQAKLRKLQRRLSKKKKGSLRHKKCKYKVALLHGKVANQRDYFLHNVSTSIVKDFDIISIEDLNVAGMIKNHKLSKSISDASFSKFFSFLQYKCKWYGKELIKIPRFAPSSKTCSKCGAVKQELQLSERSYHCSSCNYEIDRDLNAAININRIGVAILNERGDYIRPIYRQ